MIMVDPLDLGHGKKKKINSVKKNYQWDKKKYLEYKISP